MICRQHEHFVDPGMGHRYMTTCGLHLAPYGQALVSMPDGARVELMNGPDGVDCPRCIRVGGRPGYQPVEASR